MQSKQYTFSILKNESRVNSSELLKWINVVVKDNWTKKDYKTKTVYTFNDPNDALKFKMRWTFA